MREKGVLIPDRNVERGPGSRFFRAWEETANKREPQHVPFPQDKEGKRVGVGLRSAPLLIAGYYSYQLDEKADWGYLAVWMRHSGKNPGIRQLV